MHHPYSIPLSEGIAHLRRAVELAPADANNYYLLGNAYIAAKELDRAVKSLRKAVEIDPGYAEAHCNLGHALMRRGDFANRRMIKTSTNPPNSGPPINAIGSTTR